MRIPDRIFQTNKKLYVTLNTKNIQNLEFDNHLWLPFIDQPKSEACSFFNILFSDI